MITTDWTTTDSYYAETTSGSEDIIMQDRVDDNYESYIKTRETIKSLMLLRHKQHIPQKIPIKKWMMPRKCM